MNKQSKGLKIFREKCKAKKLRLTPQRTAIYQELINDRSHPSVDDVYKRVKRKFPNISFDTVYRTMLSFVDLGIVKITENYGGPKRFDTEIESHHHLYCIKCGAIIDFNNKEYDDLKIPTSIRNKYKILGKRVIIECICEKCRNKK
jgi:Fur family peroxide stress response transcriptional regulator